MRVALVGATGFIGSVTANHLRTHGHEVLPVRAPRLRQLGRGDGSVSELVEEVGIQHPALVPLFSSVDAIVNAAGVATPTAGSGDSMYAANAILPRVLQYLAREAGGARFIHVSSAAVQGRRPLLDESAEVCPFSAYSRSKAQGERLLLQAGDDRTVVYRPTSVHGPSRTLTKRLIQYAQSPLAFVGGDGRAPTPQVLDVNVASALVFLATTQYRTPEIVLHPWEGLTTGGLMRLLGGRNPRRIPRPIAAGLVHSGYAFSDRLRRGEGQMRRLEMLLLGQGQQEGWLRRVGWTPSAGEPAWKELAQQLGDSAI